MKGLYDFTLLSGSMNYITFKKKKNMTEREESQKDGQNQKDAYHHVRGYWQFETDWLYVLNPVDLQT